MPWRHEARLAVILLKSGKVEAGFVLVSGLIAQEPDNAEMHFMFGKTYEEIGEICLAIKLFQKAASLNGKNPDYYSAIERLYSKHGCIMAGDVKLEMRICTENDNGFSMP